jgi:gamma-glutamyl hercynylcysteine S-oxide synthase
MPAEDALKELIATELIAARDRSFGLTADVLDEADLIKQHSPLMSQLVWDLAHIGNYEELWLLRQTQGATAMRPEIDDLYDAFEHPRAERPTLPLLSPVESRAYITTVRQKVLDSLDQVRFDDETPLTAGGFVYGMVIQHEHMHDETMLATHQLRKDGPALLEPEQPSKPPLCSSGAPPARPLERLEVLVEGGPFLMGTSDDPWAYDNERPGHVVDVPAFYLDTVPVSCGDYLAFMAAGGYEDPRWWDPASAEWRRGKQAPAFWFNEGGQWLRRRFGRIEPVPVDEPVQHVSWYEADAYARWAGKRLPTEAEWEKAASWDPVAARKRAFPWGEEAASGRANLGLKRLRPAPTGSYSQGASAYGALQMLGDVWEWTSTDFHGYPGFRSFPYKEYSEVFFGSDYKILKGGSWATHPLACRTTFRNWDYPIRRQIFSGFRCARDVA